jgi:hypothetical protein
LAEPETVSLEARQAGLGSVSRHCSCKRHQAVPGTLLTSSLPDSRHSLCISERQLRSGRNFASTPGFYALIREILEGEFFSGAMAERALCPEAENNSKNRFPFTKKMGRLAIIVCALER